MTASQRPIYASVPAIVDDVLMWLLTPAEYICLRYVIRHTFGYSDGRGARKERDMIALSQFENGITSGRYLIDGGTGMTRNTIKGALRSLKEKGLLDTRHACVCLWEQEAGEPDPPPKPGAKSPAPACPRCSRTLSTSYSVAELKPSKLTAFLNTHDKLGRTWSWDDEKARFAFREHSSGEEEREVAREQELREQGVELWQRLWFKDMVKQAIDQAGRNRKSGSNFKPSTLIHSFIQPVLDMQEIYPAPIVEKALSVTLHKKIPGELVRGSWNRAWHRYALAICARNATSGATAPAGSRAHSDKALRDLASTVGKLLAQAAKLNGVGEHDAAHQMLDEILSHSAALAPLFGRSADQAEFQLRLAFKQGSSDLHVRRNQHGLDFYPGWNADRAAAEAKSAAPAASSGQGSPG